MRKLVVTEALSLDGVMEAPAKWLFPYNSPDMDDDSKAQLSTFDALLLGRITYEEFAAYWPTQDDSDFGIANKLNSVSKYIVSNTLEKVEWNNSTLIRGDLTEEIFRLKQQDGKDISITGSGKLVHSLMQLELIDEYHLMVYPIVVGSGRRFFSEGNTKPLKLIKTKKYSSGAIALTYQPDTK